MDYCNACFEYLGDIAPVVCPFCGQDVRGEDPKPKPKAPSRKRVVAKVAAKPAPKPTAPKPERVAPPSDPVSEWALCAVLIASCIAIRLQGRYRKTSEANSTKDFVLSLIMDEEVARYVSEEDELMAKETEAWIDGLSGSTDYEDSLKQAVRRARRDGEVIARDVGRLASAVAGALRAEEQRQAAEQRASQPTVFAGVAGANGRQDLGTVTIDETRYMSAYDNWLVKGRLVAGPFEGARVAWFERNGEPEKGSTAQLRAKVKSHNERYGETQISLVRLD